MAFAVNYPPYVTGYIPSFTVHITNLTMLAMPNSFSVPYGTLFYDNDITNGDRLTITAGPLGFSDFTGLPWIHNDPGEKPCPSLCSCV